MRRRSFEIGLLLAGVAHMALVASLRAPRADSRVATPSEAAMETILIEPTVEPIPAPPPPSTEPRTTTPAPREAIAMAIPTRTSSLTPTSPANEPPTPSEPSSPSSPSDSVDPVVAAPSSSGPSTWSYVFKNGAASTSPLGSSAPSFAMNRPAIYGAEPPERKSNGGLSGAGHDRDLELGLGSGGPMISPTEEATRMGRTPVNGFGVVIARFGPDGAVLDVHVVDDSGDREAWNDVAKDIAEAMRSKRVKIPRGSNGIEITIRVDTRWQLPDGSDPDPYKVCVMGLPCNAGEHRRTITISPLGLMGAIPTSGGGATRVVHARVVNERAM